jgi:hypothetical protein
VSTELEREMLELWREMTEDQQARVIVMAADMLPESAVLPDFAGPVIEAARERVAALES